MYSLKNEILMFTSENSSIKIGIDNKHGDIIKTSISISELFNGRNKTLLNKKVKDVIKGCGENQYIFILNSK